MTDQTPTTVWTLRDIDNRGPDDDPYEITDTPEALAAYVDGPVRGDLTASADTSQLDDLVAAFVAGDLHAVQTMGRPFAICVHPSEPDTTEAQS